jgi:hypothetical protein
MTRTFRSSRPIRALFLLAVATIGRPGQLWAQSVERAIYVSVLDQGGAPVSNLTAGDVVVREGGVPRAVLRVSAATDSLQIAVMVDTSQAIEPYLSAVQSALRSFSREIQDRHERALFALDERPTLIADYSRDPARLDAGIGSLRARTGGGASVPDAIAEVSRGLRRRGATRPVIVVITAEGSEPSEGDRQAELNDLRETDATVHVFVLGTVGASLVDETPREYENTSSQGVRASGERREELMTVMTLGARLQRLAAELNNQYLVVYAQPRSASPPDAVDVNVTRSWLTVHASLAPRKPGTTCRIVETNTSRDQAFFGYQCR